MERFSQKARDSIDKMPGIAYGREKGYPTTKVNAKARPARSVGVSTDGVRLATKSFTMSELV